MEIHGVVSVQIFMFWVIILLQDGCNGFCFIGTLMAEKTVSRRVRYFCEYKGTDGHSMKLFPGSNLYLVDQCLDCRCTMDGLQCCGFGHAGGAVAIRKDCKMLLDGCQALLVKVKNQTLDCFTGKPINFTSMSQQLPHPDNTYKSLNIRIPLPPTLPPETTTTAATTTTTATPTTTTAAPITMETTTQKPRPVGQSGTQTATMEDFYRYLMLTQASSPNRAPESQYLQYLNTANTPLHSLAAPAQQPPPVTNLWQYDYFLPWFLFV